MPQYSAIIDFNALTGVNGFRIDGLAAGDVLGYSVAAAGDVNADGFADFVIGAENADPGARTDAGESYVVFGAASWAATFAPTSLNGANGFRIPGLDAGDANGFGVGGGGDFNGDGFADILIGALGGDANAADAGEAYVIFGAASGWGASFDLAALNGANGFRLDGNDASDYFGWAIADAGDVNGDGIDDLIVSAALADPGGDASAGESYVVFGAASGWGASFDVSTLNGANGFRIDGIDANDFAGTSIASAGDLNGDGFDDLIIGAYAADPGGDAHAGETYIVFGHATGWGASLDLAALNGSNGFRLDGIDLGDRSGWSVSGAGDINADGYADIVIGAILGDAGGSNAGEVYVLFGQAGGWSSAIDLATLNGANGFRIDGGAANHQLGYSVAGAGDVNGDGFDDLILGSTNGPTFVVFGASAWSAAFSVNALNGDNGYRLDGATSVAVAGAGDVNGDGIADMLIGAPYVALDTGAAFVVFGGAPGAAVSRAGTAIANTIYGSAFADQLFGLGGGDTLIGGDGGDLLDGGAGLDTVRIDLVSGAATWQRDISGAWTVTSAAGVDTLVSVEYIHFTDRIVHLDRAATNFSGDGASDILLRRDDGVTAIWSMNGASVTASDVTQYQAGSEWGIEALGDFNNDGRDDFLLRRVSDGVTAIWSMNGVNVVSANVTTWQAGLEWAVQGAGDFNGDGVDDFLWRRDDGVTAIWQMDGPSVVNADVTAWQADNEWAIAAIADFNGDGRDDFLWRRESDGVMAVWSMNGAAVAAADVTSQQAGLEWNVVGAGDFDGDGRDDLLIRNADGVTAIWRMDGANVLGAELTSQQAGLDWSIAAVGDYNGDGRDDILLRHDSGVTAIWTMDGVVVVSADLTSQQAGVEWGFI